MRFYFLSKHERKTSKLKSKSTPTPIYFIFQELNELVENRIFELLAGGFYDRIKIVQCPLGASNIGSLQQTEISAYYFFLTVALVKFEMILTEQAKLIFDMGSTDLQK